MKFLKKYLNKRSKSNQNDKNKLIDQNQVLDDDIYEVDIYSKEKGEE